MTDCQPTESISRPPLHTRVKDFICHALEQAFHSIIWAAKIELVYLFLLVLSQEWFGIPRREFTPERIEDLVRLWYYGSWCLFFLFMAIGTPTAKQNAGG